MKVNIYTALLNEISKHELFQKLKSRNKNQQHIIICPDRSTLNIEKELFEVLDERCFFDLSVITLSRLAKRAISQTSNQKILTKNSAVALVKKILLENKQQLTSFKNAISLNGFASELYNTMCLFKSCHVAPADIDTAVTNKTLQNKLADIKLIYQKYEEFLQSDYTDSFNQLDLFAQCINKQMYANVNFYFVMFEDFTKQQYNIIEKLIKHANSVSFATTNSKAQQINNKSIHLNSIYLSVLDKCRYLGVIPNVYKKASQYDSYKNFLLENLFSLNKGGFSAATNAVKLRGFKNINDEVKHTMLDIKHKIINNNVKFKDFTIIVPSLLSYSMHIKKQCEKLNIPFYLDESTPINHNVFCRFMINVLNIVCGDINKYNVLGVLKSPFASVDIPLIESYEHYLNKYGLIGKALINIKNDEYNDVNSYFKSYKDALKNINTFTSFGEKLECFKEFLFDVCQKQEEDFKEKLLQDNNVIAFRTHEQVISKLNKVFDELLLVLDSHQCSPKEFSEILLAGISDVSLTLPPIAMDAVFIGEINTSFFNKNKYVYMLGANEGSMPSYQLDTSIITDKDISQLNNKNKLNPTVAVINKRKRFKVYESIFNYTNLLVISYPRQKDGEEVYPAIWFDDIKHLLNLECYDGTSDFDMVFHSQYIKNKENLIFNNVNQLSAKENFTNLLNKWDIFKNKKNYINILHTLQQALQLSNADFIKKVMRNKNYTHSFPKIKRAEQLFFKNNSTSISEIENYQQCPYKFFMNYGLKIRKLEEQEAIDSGKILHEFLEIIVPEISENINDDSWLTTAGTHARQVMNRVLYQKKYDYITTNQYNKFYCYSFLNEAERITNALIYQQKHSAFKPSKQSTEKFFNSEDSLSITVGNRKIYLKGIIDRIDEHNNSFRIIDYKTGAYSAKFQDFSDIYSGKKIQLIVYTKVYQEATKLKPAGAFYLPILNVFDKEDVNNLYKLQGIIIKNIENILSFDNNLTGEDKKSKIVNITTNKSGEIQYNKLCITESELDSIYGYVFKLMEKAIENILDGNLQPYPLQEGKNLACAFCDYVSICNYNENFNSQSREDLKVSSYKEFEALTKEEEVLS